MLPNHILEAIELNQQKIAAHGKFDDDILKKINYKLRLDWNYYSNRMEGGTLTMSETRSVMVGNIDVKGKPFKDVVEMTGHDKVVLEVLKMSTGDLRLAEKRIKEIHKAIMFEEDSQKAAQIGIWKTYPNEIINYKGEKVTFAEPQEVAEAIHKLLDRTNAELDRWQMGKASQHPIELAAQFHIDFVSIHPFYDGNGRTCRILTNILLMACGYPAIIVKDEHKQAYYQLLGDIQAYGGQADLFYTFIAERVLDTQQLVLDALAGKEIEDLSDLDKEIQLFKQQLAAKQVMGSVKKSNAVLHQLYFNCIKKLFDAIEAKHKAFDELFAENVYIKYIDNLYSSNNKERFLDDAFSQLKHHTSAVSEAHEEKSIDSIRVVVQHRYFQRDGHNMFHTSHDVEVQLGDYQFLISSNGADKFRYDYTSPPDEATIHTIAKAFVKVHFEEIKQKMGK
jgi:Fic family protein